MLKYQECRSVFYSPPDLLVSMLYSYGLLIDMKVMIFHGYKKFSQILIYSLFGLGLSTVDATAHKNVLVIHSYSAELSSVEQQYAAIEEGFNETRPQNNVFHEFLDSKLRPKSKQDQQKFINYIERKYQPNAIDLIMVVNEPSLQLMLSQHDRAFPEIPVVFLGIDRRRQELIDTPWLTGVYQNSSTAVDTAKVAVKQMWSDRIIVINGFASDRTGLEQIKDLKIQDKPLDVEIIDDLAIEHIKTRLDEYSDRVPILLLGQIRQNHHSIDLVDPSEDSKIIHQQIPNPIYSNNAIRIGRGAVGGKISDVDYHVRQAVELAQEILHDGVEPDEVGPIFTKKSRWIFDYRQLLKYNVKDNLLPEDSELLYAEQPIYYYYKYQTLIIVILSTLLACIVVIVLLIQRARKREAANKILQEDRSRYKDLAKAGANVFWELDKDLKYSYLSGDLKDLCGLEPAQMKGHYPPDLHRNNPKLNVDWEQFEAITRQRQPLNNFTYSLRDRNNEIRIFKVNGKPFFDRDYNFLGYRGVKQEITAERNFYRKIAYQATHDDLTGLLNRREFNEKLRRSIQNLQQHQKSVLCYLDLDRFKIVNDTAGHAVGDRLLLELTQLLQNMIRKEDTLGRLGGDEFGLLLERCSITEAEQIAEQLIRAINNYRLRWKNIEFNVGVSIGMVEISGSTESAADLLSRADLACYQAKNLGRGRVYIESNEPETPQPQVGHLANVSQAIEENRFFLVKQLIKPIVEENDRRQHYELLLRLKDRSGNLVDLAEFIPIAERYGVITTVDRWVLKTALESYVEYFGATQALVSINLSGASVNDERFTKFAIDSIEKSEVPGNCLCFEITETAAIAQINQAQKFINALKNIGVKFALDDFGSGLSSLSYLKNLPIDYLKIDGSLIEAIPDDEYNRVIVNSINQVAHVMGIKTIAEFVENDRILEYLSEISIDYVQGFVTGKPTAIAS